ncbi:MAG: hypothetical protein AAFR03_00490 [Pseudomonadota bacterium]
MLPVLTCYPQISLAEPTKDAEFTVTDFLQWDRDAHRNYFRVSIGMATIIARRNDKAQGACISDWYFVGEETAIDQIIDTMQEYPSYHPDAIILAFVEKRCGSMVYTGED